MIGDPTLFQRDDMVEAGWRVVTPLLDVWKALPPRNFPNYAVGLLGTQRVRRHAARRPAAGGGTSPECFEPWMFEPMILAGDIGGTNARLAFFHR